MHNIAVDGARYKINLPHAETDYIQGRIASTGQPYELSMLQNMAARLQPGDLVLDIGANIGNHSLYLASVTECVVHAFEPNIELCRGLQKSIQANGLQDRVTVHQVGVSCTAGLATFRNLDESNLGAQSLDVQHDVVDAPIRLVCLDDMQFDLPVSMIKVDVEGMEFEVLKGAIKLIQSDKPMLYVEAQTVTDFEDLSKLLYSFGYFYLNTFNATPTHLFIHESRSDSVSETRRNLFESQLTAYAQRSEEIALRELLNNANLKYAEATERERKVKQKLESANRKYRESSEQLRQSIEQIRSFELDKKELALMSRENSQGSDRILQQTKLELEKAKNQLALRDERFEMERTALEARHALEKEMLQNAKQEVEEKFQQINEKYQIATDETIPNLKENINQMSVRLETLQLSSQDLSKRLINQQRATADAHAKYRRLTSENIPTLKSKLESQDRRSRELFQQVQNFNTKLKDERQARAKAERALSAIKMSKTWKAGRYLRKASGSFADAIKLPVRLFRLRKQQSVLHLPPVPEARPAGESWPTSTKPAASVSSSAGLKTQSLSDKPSHELRIACVMDEFTFGSYQPEAQFTQLTPENWQHELDACQPELLFIESAWRGKDKRWGSKVGHCSTELRHIVSWCQDRGIPTLFWNKEDPVHFETFLTTAKLFDFVFTTDIDCVQRYKAALGHNRVYFLPFACQPKMHNPVEKYQRKDAFCFAGAYYARYPDRTRDLESFVAELPEIKPLEIYDRNYGKGHPDYQFPEQYQPYIVGTLRFDEIDKAYKGYNYAINLNSIKQSQSMFSRRVYELLGSNTLTVSNFSRGLRLMFGDLVLSSDSGEEIKRRLQTLQRQGSIDRLRLAGLRKAMSEHTYGDRLNYILEKITGQPRRNDLPSVHVIAPANSPEDVQRQLAAIQRQQGVCLSATIVVKPELVNSAEQHIREKRATGNVQVLRTRALHAQELQDKNLLQLVNEEDWIAAMHPRDHYGSHYLLDMLLATRYTDAKIIGKGSWYKHQIGSLHHEIESSSYQPTESLAARRAIISPQIALSISAYEWLQSIDTHYYDQPQQFSVDGYNYCENLPETASDLQTQVDDLQCNQGISLAQMLKEAEAIRPLASNIDSKPRLSGRQLAQWLKGNKVRLSQAASSDRLLESEVVRLSRNKALKTQIIGNTLHIESHLGDGEHEYIYGSKKVRIEDLRQRLEQPDGKPLDIHFATDPGLNINLVVLYLGATGDRLSHQMIAANRNSRLEPPEKTTQIKVGLRIYAAGRARVNSVTFGHLNLDPGSILGQSDVLVLTNHYPSYDDLYRNGFVHTRVLGYARKGVKADVFRLRQHEPIRWHEFQDVDVATGSQSALRKVLKSGRYRHVLVHFLDPYMWDVLKDFIDKIRITVWVHGAEIHPWYRRKYNIDTPEQEEIARAESEVRMNFWRDLLRSMPDNLHMVFVSHYFSSEVMQDLGFDLPADKFSVIHNPIDTELFSYVEKDPEQRKKILSIRPYTSRQYANDLAVQCVLELSKKPFFDQLSFTFIGDGALFEETVLPLRQFDNVHIEQGFITQAEIASLHKTHGIFLCPTRWDSQGVSRDEAMASGLVPLTNAIAAVPEFVDQSCGFALPSESAEQIAEAASVLFGDPVLFQELSRSAAKRVRDQSSTQMIIGAEISLLSRKARINARNR